MKPKSSLRSFLALAGSALIAISYTHAAPLYWDDDDTTGDADGGTGTWNTSLTNWDDAATSGTDATWDNGNFDTAIFGGTAGTVTLGTGITVGGLQFDAAGYTVTGNTLTFGTAGNIVTNADATISSTLAGSGTITKTGSGILTLNNTGSTYSGQLTVANGTLSIAAINNVSSNGNLGNSSALLPVILGSSGGNTGALRYTGGNASSSKTFTFAAGGTGEINVSTGATTLTLSGLINGSGGLSKTGAGTLNLTLNGNEFTGTTTLNAGKVTLGVSNANTPYVLWKSPFDTTNANGTTIGLSYLGTGGNVVTKPWLGGLTGGVNLALGFTAGYSGFTELTLNPQTGTSVSYSGVIANGAANMALNKTGHGTQTLTNTNTYSGATTVWAGTLALSDASGTAQNSAFTVRGGTLLLDNSTAWANRLNDTTALSLGTLTLTSSNGAGIQSEAVGATTFAVGGKVTINNGTTLGDQTTLALGAVSRTAGAAIDFVGTGGTLGSGADSPNVTSSSLLANTNGILPWATVGGTQWAENNSNSIRAYSGTFNTDLTTAVNTENAQTTGSLSLGAAAVASSLNIVTSGAGQSLDLGSNNLTLGSVAASPGAILKSGADSYTISGTGQVRAGSAGAGTELIAHVDGGALTISAPLNTAINNIAKGGTGDLILSGTRAGTMSGAISIAGGQLEFQGNSTTLSGVITGAGGLTVNLNAGQILTMGNNSNSYAGPTIVKGGYLASPGYNAQGMPGGLTITPSTNTSLIASNLILNGGIFYASYVFDKNLGDGPGQVQILGGTSGFVNTAQSGGAASFKLDSGRELVWGSTYFQPDVFVHSTVGNLTLNLANGFDLNGSTRTILVGDATYNANAGGGISQLGGVIRNSSGTAGLTKTGIGTLLLSGTNTYNGNTTVDQGTLLTTAAAALSGYNSAGKVVFNGGTVGVRVGGSGWTTGEVDTLLSNATKTSGQLGIDTTNGNLTQWTAFTTTNFGSALGLNKFGANTLILDQANTYTGATTVSEGTLALVGSLSGSSVSLSRAAVFVQAASGSISGSGATFTHGSTGVSILSGTNTYTGGTTISAGSLAFAKTASMPASGAVAVQTNATIGIGLGGTGEWTTGTSGNGTLGGLLGGLGGQSGSTVSYTGNVGMNLITTGSQNYGVIGNVGTSLALTKSGTGTLTLDGTNTYTGATTLNAGTLKLNYDVGAGGSDATKLANGAALNLNGGTLELSGGSHLEAVSSTTLTSGTTFVTQTNSGTAKLSMGGISFSSGAIDFSAPSIATTSSNHTNGILSQRATVAGANFAMKASASGTQDIVAYNYVTSGVTGYTGAAMVANTNYELTASGASTLAATTGATNNTLKITNASAGSLAVGANTLTVGAILFAGSADYNITTSGAGRVTPSILHNYGTGGAVLNLGALGGVLTQYGTGKTILTSTAQNGAGLNIFGGTVQVSTNAQIGTPSSGATIALNNGTLLASETLALNNGSSGHRAITLGAQGGTLAAAATKTLTVSGVISGFGNPLTIGSASSTGTVSLTGANLYANATDVIGGTLIVNGNISTSVLTTVQTGATLGGTGTVGNTIISGTHSPGNSPGIITHSGSLTYEMGSNVIWELVANSTSGRGTNFDGINVGTTLSFNAATTLGLNFDFGASAVEWQDTFWASDYTGTSGWLVYSGATSLTGFGNLGLNAPSAWLDESGDTLASVRSGASFSLYQSGNNIYLNYSAIPEPRAALLGGLGLLMLLRRRR
jgi:autotransporter-associated beta strand protein